MHNGNYSFWHTAISPAERRPAVAGDRDVDVAIVGGGLTGLWTAYYLRQSLPDASIAVVEKHFCGGSEHLAASRGQDGLRANREFTAAMSAGGDERGRR